MKRLFVAVSIMAALVLGGTTGASADQHGGTPRATGNRLIRDWNVALATVSESDPWLFDDGCTGGSGEKDPGFFVVPALDQAASSTHCTVSEDAPLVFVPAGVVCWQPTVSAAVAECESIWNGTGGVGPGVLTSATLSIDGRAQQLKLYRTTLPSFTFPGGALLDQPGATSALASISLGAIRHLDEGTHTVVMQFAYADGFAGQNTFTIDVID